jgi:AbrB family looped-hinge helix DNA binding protein
MFKRMKKIWSERGTHGAGDKRRHARHGGPSAPTRTAPATVRHDRPAGVLVTLSSKGQVCIPRRLQAWLGIAPGDKVLLRVRHRALEIRPLHTKPVEQ